MNYYINKSVKGLSFQQAIDKVTKALKDEGFGILTEIDVKDTLKKKLDVDFKPYHILGACNPPYAHQALKSEDFIGLMLPCNVIVKQEADHIDIAAIDPLVSMQAVENENLEIIALEIRSKLKNAINSL